MLTTLKTSRLSRPQETRRSKYQQKVSVASPVVVTEKRAVSVHLLAEHQEMEQMEHEAIVDRQLVLSEHQRNTRQLSRLEQGQA